MVVDHAEYDELMSLKLDGMLGESDRQRLDAHLAACEYCAPVWVSMEEADALFVSSAVNPVPVPSDFQMKVMAQVATLAVVRPQLEAAWGYASAPALPAPTRRLLDTGNLLPDYAQEWQRRIGSYVRGMAAVGLAVAGTAGILLALVVWGSLQVDAGPLTGLVETARTLAQAANTWVRSILENAGSALVVAAGLIMGLLAWSGWQVVTNYQQAALEQRGNTGYLEALA